MAGRGPVSDEELPRLVERALDQLEDPPSVHERLLLPQIAAATDQQLAQLHQTNAPRCGWRTKCPAPC